SQAPTPLGARTIPRSLPLAARIVRPVPVGRMAPREHAGVLKAVTPRPQQATEAWLTIEAQQPKLRCPHRVSIRDRQQKFEHRIGAGVRIVVDVLAEERDLAVTQCELDAARM